MLFRIILAPVIRVFRWSGLSPFPLLAKKSKSIERSEVYRLAAVTAINLLVNLVVGLQNTIQTNFNITRAFDKLLIYGDLIMAVILRVHAIVVLIESYAKRFEQSELLAKFDEIENIFAQKLNVEANQWQERHRFKKFIVIWLAKMAIFSMVLLVAPMFTFEWYNLYYLIVVFTAFYTSALSYAQWMVYVDVIRYNIERINACLMGMGRADRIDGHIFYVRAVNAQDICERLVQLRKCYIKIWEASMLINRCFCWLFTIGIGVGVYLVVFNLYTILYGVLSLKMLRWHDVVVCASWGSTFAADFVLISMICEDINAGVSIFSSNLSLVLIGESTRTKNQEFTVYIQAADKLTRITGENDPELGFE